MAERLDQRPCVRFEFDERIERGTAVMRVVGALVTILGAGWLLALPYTIPRVFAVAGLLFAGRWLMVSVRKLRNAGHAAAHHYLELRGPGLALAEGASEQFVPWEEITRVAIDEDRLVVVVERKQSAALLLEPHYGGVGLRPLAEAVQAALVRSRQHELGTQAGHG